MEKLLLLSFRQDLKVRRAPIVKTYGVVRKDDFAETMEIHILPTTGQYLTKYASVMHHT